MSCGYFPGRLVGPVNAFAQAFTFPAISAPQCARSGAIHSKNAPTLGKHRAPLGGESPDAASDNKRKHVCLALVGTLVDEKTGRSFSPPRPKISVPSSHPEEAETVEIDVTVAATLDVPEEHRLAVAVVRSLGEGAGTRDGAAAVVKPVSGDVPA